MKDKDLFYDAEEIWDALGGQGYTEEEIESALDYMERTFLKVPGPFWESSLPVHRSYSGEEMTQVSSKARGYLWTLKCRGILDHALEDEIIHKAMNLPSHVGVREIKTVAALTIFGYEHRDSQGFENANDSLGQNYH